MQEQQGRNQGRLERERKQREAKKRWIWARHQEQRDLERRKQRRRGRPARRAARAHARVVCSTARAATRSKELVVATWNVHTMSERGTNGPGHAEDLLMFAAKYECDFIAIQETRRDGRTTIQALAAGYVVHCSGHCDGDGRKPGILGVGLAVKGSIARALGPDGIVPEHISARLLEVRVIFKHRTATTFIVGYAPTEIAATCHKSKFWKELRSTVAEMPASDHLILMMDAYARTGGRGEGGGLGDVRVLRPYCRDTLNDNGSRLLACAAEYKLSIVNTFFSTPKRGGNSDAFTYEGPKESHRWRLDYILVRQHDCRLVRNITVHPKMKSDHRLVSASIRLLGRNAPNRRRRPDEGHHGVPFDRKLLTSDQCWRAIVAQEIVTKLPGSTFFAAGIPDVNSMASTFADILRQTAADTLPRRPKRPSSRGFSESPRAQARLQQAWDVRERVWEKLRARPQDPSLRKALKVTDKAFKRAKHAELQSFLREHTARTADLTRQREQAGLYQHINSLELEWKRGCKSTYIKNAYGVLLRDKPSILLRWKGWFQELLNAKSPTLDASILDGIEQLPEHAPLAAEPTVEEVKEAVGKLGNGKAVGVDNVCGELLKLGLSENSAILRCFHNIVVAVWQQEVVPQEWKDAIITVLFKKGDPYERGNFRGISLGAHAGKVVLKVVAMRLNAYCEWRKIFLEAQYGFRVGRSTDDMIYVVRGVQELAREKDLPLFMCFIDLQKAYDSVDRSLLWKVLVRYGVPAKLISIIRQFHDGMRACVCLNSGETSEWFAVEQGLRQGCVIAPDLFNIFFVAVLTVAFDRFSIDKAVLDDFVRVVRGDLTKEAAKRVLWAILYADDAGIASRS